MYLSLPGLVPNADDLLSLEVEELAVVLLVYLTGCEGNSASAICQNGLVSYHNFFNSLDHQPAYPGKQAAVSIALMEVWSWLHGEGLLVRHPDQPADWFFLSRAAKQLRSIDDYAAFRNARVLRKGRIHPLITTKVYPSFRCGEYDTAIFQAFRGAEIAVRRAGGFPDDLVDVELMREAFRRANPKKTVSLRTAYRHNLARRRTGGDGLAVLWSYRVIQKPSE
jgi:uncharacterized protein Ymh